ncbi:SRPBCC family protein [Cytobacillus horneckiae]|uniref:SRPBCC family protein n=1 Tax=Cytobacillus horneckiae TaxID=549687 RepID=UPI003D9AAB06
MSEQNAIAEIRKTVILNAPIEKVWKAISTSEGIAGWWMPNTFEPIVGKEFILHAGQFGDSPCKVIEIEPLKRVRFDWGKDWQLTFELKQIEESKIEFTLIHSGWDESKKTEFGQPHSNIREIMDGGWEGIVKNQLVKYVEA